MKIGIINFHCAHNYGAFLQAYALQETLKKMYQKVSIIDYRPKKIAEPYELNLFTKPLKLKNVANKILTYFLRRKKHNKFKEFSKKYFDLTSETFTDYERLNEKVDEFDLLICGSDQVWNPEISLLKPYYLYFDTKIKKISYAASFGVSEIKDEYKNDLKKFLSQIDKISVREKQGVNLVKDLIDKDAKHVLDPVFLLDEVDWNNITIEPKTIKYDYILVYSLELSNKLIKAANKLSEETNLNIVFLNPTTNFKNIISYRGFDALKVRDAGPKEYLGLLKNASYVITNSFHGTSFSILMKKNFITIPHKTRNSRLESLLEILKLQNNMLIENEFDNISLIDKSKFNMAQTNNLLMKEIKKSKSFLNDALSL